MRSTISRMSAYNSSVEPLTSRTQEFFPRQRLATGRCRQEAGGQIDDWISARDAEIIDTLACHPYGSVSADWVVKARRSVYGPITTRSPGSMSC